MKWFFSFVLFVSVTSSANAQMGRGRPTNSGQPTQQNTQPIVRESRRDDSRRAPASQPSQRVASQPSYRPVSIQNRAPSASFAESRSSYHPQTQRQASVPTNQRRTVLSEGVYFSPPNQLPQGYSQPSPVTSTNRFSNSSERQYGEPGQNISFRKREDTDHHRSHGRSIFSIRIVFQNGRRGYYDSDYTWCPLAGNGYRYDSYGGSGGYGYTYPSSSGYSSTYGGYSNSQYNDGQDSYQVLIERQQLEIASFDSTTLLERAKMLEQNAKERDRYGRSYQNSRYDLMTRNQERRLLRYDLDRQQGRDDLLARQESERVQYQTR